VHFINHFLRVGRGILGEAKLYYSVLKRSRNQISVATLHNYNHLLLIQL